LVHGRAIVLLERVLLLRFDKATTDLDGIEFIAPHTAISQFLNAGRRIERPPAVLPHEWDRKRPVVLPDQDYGVVPVLGIDRDRLLFVREVRKGVRDVAIVRRLRRQYDVLGFGPEDLLDGLLI